MDESIMSSLEIQAPEHLADMYSDGTIDENVLTIMSCNHYMEESESLEVKYHNAVESIVEKEQVIAGYSDLEFKFNLNKQALENSNSEILLIDTVKVYNQKLSTENAELKAKCAKFDELEKSNIHSSWLKNTYEQDNQALTKKVSELESQLRTKTNMSANHNAELVSSNEQRTRLEKTAAELKEKLSKAYIQRDEVKEQFEDLTQKRSNDQKVLSDSMVSADNLLQRMDSIEKSHNVVRKENRLLATFVNSVTPAPIFTSPEDHELRVTILDKEKIEDKDGEVVLIKDKPVFHWFNPSGHAVLVALSVIDGEETLLFPCINAPTLTGDNKEILDKLDAQLTPDKKYWPEIIKHISSLSANELKESVKRTYRKATWMAEQVKEPFPEGEYWQNWRSEFGGLRELLSQSKRQKIGKQIPRNNKKKKNNRKKK